MPSPPLYIVQSLSPRIAVLTSDDVVASCEANGCRGLEELLRPWEGGTERVSILSSALTPSVHPTFPLRFVSHASIFPNPETSSPNPDLVVDLISSLVGTKKPDDEQHYPLTRSLLLSSRSLASHETFNHPVGILLAISTSTPDPMGAMHRLQARSTGPMSQAVPWMDGVNVMRFFVVIHDVSRMGDDMAIAHELLANVKKTYGPHSTLLVINSQVESRPLPTSPDTTNHASIPLPKPFTPVDMNPSAVSQVYASALSSITLSPMAVLTASIEDGGFVVDTPASPIKPSRRKLYGAKLKAEDTQRLAALVRELVLQSLVPWMEARVREWNEVWHTHRRGITGRLFGAGRKLFSSRPSSPSPNAPQTGYNTVKGYYPVTAVESLTRRLADFAFMLRDYKFASTVYDSLRRDYAQDRAWRYAAAATEMYGLSQLLSHNYFLPSTPPTQPTSPFTSLQHTDISSWLEQAVLAYQSRAPANQIQLDALRITVLFYEAWKTIGEWRGVGGALVKAAGEADEVPSAVMIEEAASADVGGAGARKRSTGRRRRAFHLVLAARRYETAGLKTYSRRCLDRASQIYRDAPWTAAQDRIEYSLGRQAYTLGESDVAVEHFLRLLRKEDTGVPGSQDGVLEDMALAYEQLRSHPELVKASLTNLQLSTPIFDSKATRIVVSSSHASTSGTSARWSKVEQLALGSWDRKGKKPASLLVDSKRIVASVDEVWHVALVASNPLNAPLILANITVLTEPSQDLTIEIIPDLTLEPYETRFLSIPITATAPTTITITSVSFSFHRFFPCTQSLTRRGKRLHATKAHRLTPTYGTDTSLTVEIGAARPLLRVELDNEPEAVFEGEQVEMGLRLHNNGKVAVGRIQLVSSDMDILRLREEYNDTQHTNNPLSIPNRISSNGPITIHHGIIQPSSTVTVPMTFTAQHAGALDVLHLVIFSNAEDENDIGCSHLASSVNVLPLTRLAVSTRPGKEGANHYLAVTEMTNVSSVTLAVNEIQPISPYWRTSEPDSVAGLLHPNQTLRTFLQIQADDTASTLDLQRDLVSSLSKLVQGQTDVSGVPTPGSVRLSTPQRLDVLPSYLVSRQAFRVQQLISRFPTIPLSTLAHIFPLLDPLELDISVSWSIHQTDPPRRGVSILHGVPVSPSFSLVEGIRMEVDQALARGDKTVRTMYEETGRLRRLLVDSVLDGVLSQEEDPIEVRFKASVSQGGVVRHDFAKGSCSVPVIISIRNRSPAISARWMLALPGTTTDSVDRSPLFTGTLSHRGTSSAMSSMDIQTAIWAHAPGVARLSGWEIDVETGEQGPEGVWIPRKSWSRVGQAGTVQVVQEEEP